MQYFETVGGKHTTHIVKRNDIIKFWILKDLIYFSHIFELKIESRVC